jgi:hypothetical protein
LQHNEESALKLSGRVYNSLKITKPKQLRVLGTSHKLLKITLTLKRNKMSKIQYLMEKRFSFVAWLLVVVAATTLKLANETSSSWSLHSQMSHEKSHKKKNRVGLYKNGITRSQCLTAKEFFGKKTLHIK